MRIFSRDTDRIWRNVRFILEDLAEGKPGESLAIIADSQSYTNARALCDGAGQLGMNAIIIDVDAYGGRRQYADFPAIAPLRSAIAAADVCFMLTPQMRTDFGTFLGGADECDDALQGASRRFTLEAGGMSEWDFDPREVLHYRQRTRHLLERLRTGKRLHLTTALGTDFTCAVGDKADAMYPVMAIIPFYAEVAVIPTLEGTTGTFVADGASECTNGHRGLPIRPGIPGHQELHKPPLRVTLDQGRVVDYNGDPVQVARLKEWIETSDPPADTTDEVGIVTTTSRENDIYGWSVDRTHQTHCVHVALGNNRRRGEVIHAPEHVDFDVHDPTITLDGVTVYENRTFNDAFIFQDGSGS